MAKSVDVHFRLGTIPFGAGEMGMVILAYNSRSEALDFYRMLHRYITASGLADRLFSIQFTRSDECPDHYTLVVYVAVDDEERHAVIRSIQPTLVAQLRATLDTCPVFMLAAGYETTEGFELLDPKEFNFFRGAIAMDNEIVTGKHVPGFTHSSILENF